MAQQLGKGLTVLVVDDDDDVRAITAVIVRELGFQVLEANGGSAALEILRGTEPVDLLFTDVAMPGMGGPELAFLAKQLRPNLNVVYASAYVHMSERDPSLRFGPLIEKPWTRDRLVTVLEALFASPDDTMAPASSLADTTRRPDQSGC